MILSCSSSSTHSVSQELQLDALFTGVVLRDKGRFPGFHHPAGGAYRFLTVLGLKMKVRKKVRTVILPPDLLSLLINSSQVKASRFTLIHSTSTQDTGGWAVQCSAVAGTLNAVRTVELMSFQPRGGAEQCDSWRILWQQTSQWVSSQEAEQSRQQQGFKERYLTLRGPPANKWKWRYSRGGLLGAAILGECVLFLILDFGKSFQCTCSLVVHMTIKSTWLILSHVSFGAYLTFVLSEI